ncbi:MAG TPA: DUF4424 family protein [Aestuariivirga sp.]|nr:DUF4424 family protein [Aestuariivirga sp.]
MFRPAISFVLFVSLSTAAAANDSIATVGAGGLELVHADTITMADERLYISTGKVAVDYVFYNQSDVAKTYLVAFPMPLIEPSTYYEGDIALADREADNFLNFKTIVDGQPVMPDLELRAFSGPVDITDQLKAAGLPLNPLQQKTTQAVSALSADAARTLEELGAIGQDGDARYPRWTLKATYYWLQVFPPQQELKVSHSYEPGTGTWFYYSGMLDDDQVVHQYCIDNGTAAAMRRGTKDGRDMVLAHEVRYVLSTGSNWQGPISDFRLVVDKGDPDAIVSFCMDGVKKISPTQFEVSRTDFIPTGDLSILVVMPMAKE